MAITAKEIQEQGFEHSRKGYDVEEVDVFLERVAQEVDNLNRQNSELRVRLAESQEATQIAPPVDTNPSLSVELAEAQAQVAELKGKLEESDADTEAISAAIISAQKSADKIRQDARDDAKRIFDEAETKSREVIREALDRKKKTLDDLSRLKDTRDKFQNEYFTMVKKFEEEGAARFSDSDDIFSMDMSAYEDDLDLDEFNVDSEKTGSMNPVQRDNKASLPAADTSNAPVSSYGDTEDDIDIEDLD